MPTISRFYGILILMYWNDHAPPHFHARYAGDEAVYRIDPVGCVEGALPSRADHMVLEWASSHQEELLEELLENWEFARRKKPLHKIPPLD